MIAKLLFRYKHINWAIADQLLVSGVNFLISIVIARTLGLEAFGQFTMIWLIVLFLSNLQESLLLSPMISISAKLSANKVQDYFNGVFSLGVLFAFVAPFILALFMLLFPQYYLYSKVSESIILILFVIFLLLFQETLRRILFAKSEIKLVFINDLISYLGQLFLLVLLIVFKDTIELLDVFLVIGASTLAAVIFSYFSLQKLLFSLRKSLYVWRRNWPMAKWMVLSAISNWFTANIFIIIAGLYIGNSAVGALKAAQNVLGVNHVLFKLIENIAPVKASKLLAESGINEMVFYLKKLTVISMACFSIFVLIIIAYSQELMTFIYGTEYTKYSWLLLSYSGIYFCLLLGFPLRIFLRSLENTKHIFYAYLTTGIFSLVLSKFFVIQWALQGVISGMLIVNVIMLIILMVFVKCSIGQYSVGQYKADSTL